MNCDYFLPISGLPFCFLSNVFQRAKSFNFGEFQLNNFFFLLFIRNLCLCQCQNFFILCFSRPLLFKCMCNVDLSFRGSLDSFGFKKLLEARANLNIKGALQ